MRTIARDRRDPIVIYDGWTYSVEDFEDHMNVIGVGL